MTRAVTTVTREMTVRELNDMFERDDFNTYPVQEEAEAVGIVTKFDLLKCFAFTPNQMVPRYADLMNRTVADVMTPGFINVRPDTKLTRVLQLMVEHRIRSVPVDRWRPSAGRHHRPRGYSQSARRCRPRLSRSSRHLHNKLKARPSCGTARCSRRPTDPS